jgi:TPR repeat protein
MKGAIGFLCFLSVLAFAHVGSAGSADEERAARIADWQHKAVYGAKHGPQVVAWAQYHLAVSYLNGDGVPLDEAEALWWLRLSAERGYAPAQYLLARLYAEGRVLERSYEAAVYWFRSAASQEHRDAQRQLSLMYANGMGVRSDLERASYWAQRAAENGEPTAHAAAPDVAADR